MYCIQFTVYSAQWTVCSVQWTANVTCTVTCTVYSVQWTVYSVHFTVYSVQCKVYSLRHCIDFCTPPMWAPRQFLMLGPTPNLLQNSSKKPSLTDGIAVRRIGRNCNLWRQFWCSLGPRPSLQLLARPEWSKHLVLLAVKDKTKKLSCQNGW